MPSKLELFPSSAFPLYDGVSEYPNMFMFTEFEDIGWREVKDEESVNQDIITGNFFVKNFYFRKKFRIY